MGKGHGPQIPMDEIARAVGIDPRTRLPLRSFGTTKAGIKALLRIVDEQDAVNRYTWYNLPNNISSQFLERLLYYKGQLVFFYDDKSEKFYFMPYALNGSIDFYGRYNEVKPIPITTGGTDIDEDVSHLLENISLDVQYGMMLDAPDKDVDINKMGVILHDYTHQLPQTIIPRQQLNDCLLDVMAECVPYMRTNLIAATGVKGLKVDSADNTDDVDAANIEIKIAALEGEMFVPVLHNAKSDTLNDGQVGKSEEYMLAMQSLDNLRLSTYGIDNGGLFEKKAHTLQTEADINGGPVGLVLQDGLAIRQNFCDIVNSIWGLGIWCEVNQNISGADVDGDGLFYEDNQDGANSGVETPQQEQGGEE